MTLIVVLNVVLAILIVGAMVALHAGAILSDRRPPGQPVTTRVRQPQPVRPAPIAPTPRRPRPELGAASRAQKLERTGSPA